jgi:hypothetical protein
MVEVVQRLRGNVKAKTKREPRRGLAQSTGGLGANNFVTILERMDGSPVQNLWTPSPSQPPGKPARQKKSPPKPPSDEGRIETFTILYVTPDGFLPPLALALIRDRKGSLFMAQGEDITHLKIGRQVYLRQVGGTYLFTVKSHLRRVREALKRLWRRVPSIPKKRRSIG